LVLSPTGSINLGFTTEGRLAAVLIITFSWGLPTGRLYTYNIPTSTPHHQDSFKTKLCKAHIPSGLIKIMRDKFLNLKQGGMSVSEYLNKFTSWGRYASNNIESDEKKEHFLNRLHGELQTYLVVVPYSNLEAMVDATIMVEDKHKAAHESRKRRRMSQGGPSSQRSRSLPPARPAPPPQ
jgi:hypothetical protein